MSKVHFLKIGKKNGGEGNLSKRQLELPFDNSGAVGTLVFTFEENLQPWTIRNIVIRDGISCLADLRHVPYFAGSGGRHAKIGEALMDCQVPVFHVGAEYFADQQQEESSAVRLVRCWKSQERFSTVGEHISKALRSGACLSVVDHRTDVTVFAKCWAEFVCQACSGIQVKVNESWARINVRTGR